MNRASWIIPSASKATPISTIARPKRSAAYAGIDGLDAATERKNWKIVKPNPISERQVRRIDMSVRSALIRVR